MWGKKGESETELGRAAITLKGQGLASGYGSGARSSTGAQWVLRGKRRGVKAESGTSGEPSTVQGPFPRYERHT